MDACEECGFDPAAIAIEDIAARLQALGPAYRAATAGASVREVTERPRADVWSVQEYVSHVRDVLLVQRDWVVLARVEERPTFARMHREERVAFTAYDAFVLAEVLDQLEVAAALCAVTFADLDGAAWERRFIYSWPEPAEQDLRWLGAHTVHEGMHHLFDVQRILRATRAG